MNEIPLNSSALLSCLYDSQSQFLWIRFRRGEHYPDFRTSAGFFGSAQLYLVWLQQRPVRKW